ncbi:GNAT family N-acetyltransferase [Streptomyces sp. NPDC056463]|uniref:GNAT family N-acetyltransferase n=1 Tax=unclassified Streptomyces TaxID=2593676 RepID=UPI003677F33E
MTAPVEFHAPATPTAPALLLRPWRAEDVAELVEVYRDPVLRRWTRLPVDDVEAGARWVEDQARGWAAGDRFTFAVVEPQGERERGELVANLVLKGVVRGAASAEVGYWTAAPARGRGVAPRALEALTRWAFDTFGPYGLTRLELLHQVDNVASCRVAEKSGYGFDRILAATPPDYPLDGHLHVRHAPAGT